jgi:hypothetical protein
MERILWFLGPGVLHQSLSMPRLVALSQIAQYYEVKQLFGNDNISVKT